MVSGEELRKELRERYGRFRESPLFWQIIGTAGLVAVTGLISVLPPEPTAKARQALQWTVTHDYDFAGRWESANKWAAGRGGWRPAVSGLWTEQTARTKKLLPALPVEIDAGERRPSGKTADPPPAPVTKPVTKPVTTPGTTPGTTPVAGPEPMPEPADDPAATTVLPVQGKVLYGFGWLPKGKEPHGGVDFDAPVGAAVAAIADGTVLRVTTDSAIGGLVEVDHGFVIALYGQVGGAKVKVGEKVKQGQTLATIAKPTGKEGEAGAHLHFEVRATRGGKPVDPAPFLPLEQGGEAN